MLTITIAKRSNWEATERSSNMSRKQMLIGIILQLAQAVLCFSLMGIRWYFDMAPQWIQWIYLSCGILVLTVCVVLYGEYKKSKTKENK